VRSAGCTELSSSALTDAGAGYVKCIDRRQAIRAAIAGARAGDCVLIAGKGHEKVQIVGAHRQPFDDVAEAQAALAERAAKR
jgi:UDP-N-acetylmuramoyl-L-alanyl-D-glutamate--2,6-diaminopimelate ligase